MFSYGIEHPSLVRVEESPFNITFIMYAIDHRVDLQKVDELQGAEFKIGYIKGSKRIEDILASLINRNIVSSESIITFNTYEVALRNLKFSNIDLLISN